MSNITSKILGLGGMAVVFAGMSFGQTLSCTYSAAAFGAEPNPILDRVEDTTALVADTFYTCTAQAGGTTITGASATVFLNEPVTSKILTAATNTSDAVLIINDTTTPANSGVYQGVVAGQSVIFSSITIPNADNFTIRIANVRVNASLAPATTNFPVTEGLFISNQGVAIYSNPAPVTVGIVLQGFQVPKLVAGSVASYVLCTANPIASAGTSFSITETGNFGGAFKTQAPAGTCPPTTSSNTCLTNGDQGSYTGPTGTGVTVTGFNSTNTGAGGTATAGLGTATHGDRFQFAFANIPTGATVYVPTTIAGTNGLALTLVASATGAISPLATNAPAGSSASVTGGYGLTASATGTASAYYEVTTTTNAPASQSFTLTGTVVAARNFASTAQGAITVTVTPAPSSGTDIPTFAASTNTALTLNAFGICQTTLLFPFVAAGGGFDTGVAISNTALDPLAAGATASGTTGACTFNFYGSGAPSPSTNVTLPTATFSTLAPGATGAFSLAGSSVAPNFVGYMIAQCGFQYAHGFSYITYNNGTPNATAEGYLALVLPNNRTIAGGVETLTQ